MHHARMLHACMPAALKGVMTRFPGGDKPGNGRKRRTEAKRQKTAYPDNTRKRTSYGPNASSRQRSNKQKHLQKRNTPGKTTTTFLRVRHLYRSLKVLFCGLVVRGSKLYISSPLRNTPCPFVCICYPVGRVDALSL